MKKTLTLKNAIILLNGRENVFNFFENGSFWNRKQGKRFTITLDQVFNHKQLKISTPKQILQELPMALAQVKAGNTSENLVNEIREIISSLYWEKIYIQKVYNNIMNSIKL